MRCAGYPISTVGPGSSRRCLRPGGFAYLAEFHPFADILDDRKGRTVTLDYFAEGPRSGMSGRGDAQVTSARRAASAV